VVGSKLDWLDVVRIHVVEQRLGLEHSGGGPMKPMHPRSRPSGVIWD
jgi:hypothetical protein